MKKYYPPNESKSVVCGPDTEGIPRFVRMGAEVWKLMRLQKDAKCYLSGIPLATGTLAYAPTGNGRRFNVVKVSVERLLRGQKLDALNFVKKAHPKSETRSRRHALQASGALRRITLATKVCA